MVVRSPRTGEGVAVDEEVERAGRIKRKKNQSDKHFKDDNSASPIYSLLRDATRRSSAMRFDSTEFYDRREGGRHEVRATLDRYSTKAARPSVASLRDDKSPVMSNVTGGRAPTINATLGLIVAQRFR